MLHGLEQSLHAGADAMAQMLLGLTADQDAGVGRGFVPRRTTTGSFMAIAEQPTDDELRKQAELRRQDVGEAYPVPGVVNDSDNGRYLVAPDYWVWWSSPTAGGHGHWWQRKIWQPREPHAATMPRRPPSYWWESRKDAAYDWRRLLTGMPRKVSGELPEPASGVGSCITPPGDVPEGAVDSAKWWRWLELPSSMPVSVSADLKNASKAVAGNVLLDLGGKCKSEVKLDNPAGTWADYSSKDMNFGQRVDWPQQTWLDWNSMRRADLEGYPEALTPWGIRKAVPRLSRTEMHENPATMEPNLAHPGMPINSEDPSFALAENMRLFVGSKPVGTNGILHWLAKMGDTDRYMDPAVAVLLREEPEFLARFMKGQINPIGEVAAAAKESSKPAGAAAAEELSKPAGLPKPSKRPEIPWTPPPHAPEEVFKDLQDGFDESVKTLKVNDAGEAAYKTNKAVREHYRRVNRLLPSKLVQAQDIMDFM
mmetsp:Transcript_110996/g.312949  ORF Transcript_110996/g.312949 Transcript_110996/m.312949 type:complete len:481 (-) Transcript_110996:134-1576(-)